MRYVRTRVSCVSRHRVALLTTREKPAARNRYPFFFLFRSFGTVIHQPARIRDNSPRILIDYCNVRPSHLPLFGLFAFVREKLEDRFIFKRSFSNNKE